MRVSSTDDRDAWVRRLDISPSCLDDRDIVDRKDNIMVRCRFAQTFYPIRHHRPHAKHNAQWAVVPLRGIDWVNGFLVLRTGGPRL